MKQRHLFILALITGLFAMACNSNDQSAGNNDTDSTALDSGEVEVIDTIFSAETIARFNTLPFSTYAKQQAPGFDWGNFVMTSSNTDTLHSVAFKPGKDYYNYYGALLKYSPDSSRFLDLDSYSVDVKKDSKGKLNGEALGPDTEVSLVLPDSAVKKRVLFLGPNGSVEDAVWLNNEDFAIFGVHDYGDSTGKVAAIWKYNIPTHTMFLYEMPEDSVAAQKIMGYGRKERLKNLLNK